MTACIKCWHSCTTVGTLIPYINFTGGVLDSNRTCTTCKWNDNEIVNCKHCTPNLPCPNHYPFFNIQYYTTEMHKRYMRNSPYNVDWSKRPECIGTHYASYPSSYKEIIHIAKQMVDDYIINSKFNHLLLFFDSLFWSKFEFICLQFFSDNSNVSRAMRSYYNALSLNAKSFRHLHNMIRTSATVQTSQYMCGKAVMNTCIV
tara:strand:- start:81 stop:686 length:606 start_codon:yes stop_codon:yes gene_type:complete